MIQDENMKVKSPSVVNKGFHPIILQRDNSFCVYLPEWKVSGEGASLDEAFQQYELNKRAAESRFAKFGLATVTPDPYPTLKRGAILQDLGLFFVKVASSAFAVILVVVLLLPNIGAAFGAGFRHQFRGLFPSEFGEPKFWAIRLPSELNARLDRLKPEEQEQMRDEWNRLLGRTPSILSPLTCRPQDKIKPARP
jgi:hypothetical protein